MATFQIIGTLQTEFAPIHVYVVENTANGRCYVGQATDLSTHALHSTRESRPHKWLQMPHYMPFEQYFHMSDLGIVFVKAAADCADAEHIAKYAATGPGGYNTLRTAPGKSRKYWFLEKRNLI
ncbi:TPA: hypothetical protein ACH3X1_014650 [Trebouxia sp. C0004]